MAVVDFSKRMPDDPGKSGTEKGAKDQSQEPDGLLVDAARAIGSALGTLAAKTMGPAKQVSPKAGDKPATAKSQTSFASKPAHKKKAAPARPGKRSKAKGSPRRRAR